MAAGGKCLPLALQYPQHRLGLRAMSLRQKLIRLSLWTLALLFLLLVTAIAAMTWTAHQNRRRAEELLSDIQSLRIGESSATDALRIVHKYESERDQAFRGGRSYCGSNSASYTMTITNNYGGQKLSAWLPESPWLGSVFASIYEVAARLAPPIWWLRAWMAVEDARVVCTDFRLTVVRSDSWFLFAGVETHPPWPPSGQLDQPQKAYLGPTNAPSYEIIPIHVTGPGEAFRIGITHHATLEERSRAFSIDLDCLTRVFGECRHPCEMMPAAWTHEARTNPNPEYDRPPGISEPSCQDLLTTEQQD